jgi:hypothetical protein
MRRSARLIRPLVTASVALGAVAGTGYAQDDGYYCTGPDYIAWQLGLAAPPVAPHKLFTVRYPNLAALDDPTVTELPQFQVQGMRCSDQAVEVASGDSVYTVPLTWVAPGAGVGARARQGELPPEFSRLRNLAGLNPGGIRGVSAEELVLRRSGTTRVVLHIASMPLGSCVDHVSTRLLLIGLDGTVDGPHVILNGRRHRECGAFAPGRSGVAGNYEILLCRGGCGSNDADTANVFDVALLVLRDSAISPAELASLPDSTRRLPTYTGISDAVRRGANACVIYPRRDRRVIEIRAGSDPGAVTDSGTRSSRVQVGSFVIPRASLTRWEANEAGIVRLLLFRSADAGHALELRPTSRGFVGTGRRWSYHGARAADAYPPVHFVVVRRLGPSDLTPCLAELRP